MGLHLEPDQPESDVAHLVTEARKVLTQTAESMYWAYCQLENYETNNTKDVSAKDFLKGFGADQKEFVAIKRAMKRWLIRFSPVYKEKIAGLHPKKAK
jgi:uncharacterized protein YdiU (UPF0061 family)